MPTEANVPRWIPCIKDEALYEVARKRNLLLESVTLPFSGKILSNSRVIKAATMENLADNDTGLPSKRTSQFYSHIAKKSPLLGLMETGNIQVDPTRLTTRGEMVLSKETSSAVNYGALKARWTSVSKSMKSFGALAIAQLSHPGSRAVAFSPASKSVKLPEPRGPSSIPYREFSTVVPGELTLHEINEIQDRFVYAAKLCEEFGFDGIQLHSAHHYLLRVFLDKRLNQRTDEYGGSAYNRGNLLCTLVEKIKAVINPSFSVSVKLDADMELSDLDSLIQRLDKAGVDFIEFSGSQLFNDERRYLKNVYSNMAEKNEKEQMFFFPEMEYEGIYTARVKLARDILKRDGIVTKTLFMITGGLRTTYGMSRIVESGVAELVGLGRSLILEPSVVNDLLIPTCGARVEGVLDYIGSSEYDVPQDYVLAKERISLISKVE